MTQDQAYTLIALLVASTTGWTDEAATTYARAMTKWEDVIAATTAIEELAQSWTGMARPTLGKVRESYHAARQRRLMSAPAALPEAVCPWEHGVIIMKEAYAEHTGRAWGEEPTPDPDRAAALIAAGASYEKLVEAMHNDHKLAQTSLKALERRLRWDNQGHLALVGACA